MKQHGIAVNERRSPPARVVAAVGLLDLDYLGAHVAEDHAGHRPRHRLPDLDHPDARERPGHFVSPSGLLAAPTTIRSLDSMRSEPADTSCRPSPHARWMGT